MSPDDVVLQRTPIHIGVAVVEGVLVYVDGALVAVASLLDNEHGELAGQWFVDAPLAFPSADRDDLLFADLTALREWIAKEATTASGPSS